MSQLPGVEVFPTQEELLGFISPWHEVLTTIKKFDRLNLLNLAAQISLDHARKYLADADSTRLRNLLAALPTSSSFSRRQREGLTGIVPSLNPTLFLNEQVLHFFTLAVLEHGIDNATPELNIEQNLSEAARLFFMLTDHLEKALAPAEKDFPHILASFVRQTRFSGHGNHIANKIIMQKRIIDALVGVDEITMLAFGTVAKNYFLFCVVGLISAFVDPRATPRIDPDYFRNAAVPPDLAAKWMQDLTQNYDDFIVSIEALRRTDTYPNPHDFGSLKKKPLIRIHAGSLSVLSFPAMMNKLTYGVWGACLAAAKQIYGIIEPWATAFGNAYESVVVNLLEKADKSRGRVQYFKNPHAAGSERADLIIVDGDRMAVFEIKTLVIAESDLTDTDQKLADKISKTLFGDGERAEGRRNVGALRQLANAITDLLAGKLDDFPTDRIKGVEKIFPVLVTYEDSWEVINQFNCFVIQKLSDIPALTNARVQKPQVINSSGVDCLVAAIESGESPLDFLQARLALQEGRLITEQFAHATGRRLSPISNEQKFNDIFAFIKIHMFPADR